MRLIKENLLPPIDWRTHLLVRSSYRSSAKIAAYSIIFRQFAEAVRENNMKLSEIVCWSPCEG